MKLYKKVIAWFRGKSLLYCDGSDLIPHAWTMQASVTFVVLEPFVQTVFVKLMAALALDDLTCYRWICSLNTMRAYPFELVFTDWAYLTLRVTHPTCYCIPLDNLKDLGVLFLHGDDCFAFTLFIGCSWYNFYKRYTNSRWFCLNFEKIYKFKNIIVFLFKTIFNQNKTQASN